MIASRSVLFLSTVLACVPVTAADISVTMQAAGPTGAGATLGVVRIEQSPHGLVLRPALTGLASGMHGFHVHEHPSCAPGMRDGTPVAALGAGVISIPPVPVGMANPGATATWATCRPCTWRPTAAPACRCWLRG